MAFGRRVRQLRQAREWSQENLADASGLHRTYIGALERGERNVALLNVLRLSQALGVRPADLLPSSPPRGGASPTPTRVGNGARRTDGG
jgi:transcriptional regulator with XRE-family HTH domain